MKDKRLLRTEYIKKERNYIWLIYNPNMYLKQLKSLSYVNK